MKNILRSIAILSVSLFWAGAVQAQTTAFTYQGRLINNSAPANGNFDMQFVLFDALTGGAQIGSLTLLVPVTDGIFSVRLDFGTSFPGANRFLEISVRPAGGGAFTTLTPRQAVTSAPYAVTSLNAAQLGGFAATQYVMSGQGAINAATQFEIGGSRILSNAGTNNIFAGVQAGLLNSTGNNNSFFGRLAGSTNSTGNNNSFFGFGAGASNTTSNDNAFFGSQTGQFNTTGSQNSFFGRFAGFLNTTGSFNSFFGTNAGISNTTGNGNSFFGRFAGQSNTTGINNSFFGANAGLSNTTSSSNSFFGISAGQANTTGTDNSFFGANAGINNTTASFNAFFGRNSGEANTTGASNSFFGAVSGLANTTGTENSFIGANAGLSNTTGESNSFFGTNAGQTNTVGSHNTIIGVDADVSAGNLTFATAIGAGAIVSTNNTVVVGRPSDTVNVRGNLNVAGNVTGKFQISANGGNMVMGDMGCVSPFTGISFNMTLNCVNYSIIGDGTNTIINRSTGGIISFREGSIVQMVISSGGAVTIATLAAAGSTALCRNALNQISTCSSSIRYKQNVNSFRSGLALIKQLRPVSFNWRADNQADLGLVAEEVSAVEPLLTTLNEKGEVEGVKYDRLGVVLVNAVNEQQTQIEAQQKQLDEQNALIKDQAQKLDKQQSEIEALKLLVCSQNAAAEICKPKN